MNMVWFYTLFSVLLVSLISLLGISILSFSERYLQRVLILLVSFSSGALLGDALFHILPEAVEEFGFSIEISSYLLGGILVFFVLEKFINWHHCHRVEDQHHQSFVLTNLFGDGLHNFVDGLFIASSYLVSPSLGIATTIAVVLHEIPQELGDFGVLMHGGLAKKKAIFLNFISAWFALLGGVIGLLLGGINDEFLKFILPFTAGGFLYIACTDLFPELHKKSDKGLESFLHLLMVLAGIGAMLLLLNLEG